MCVVCVVFGGSGTQRPFLLLCNVYRSLLVAMQLLR